MVLFLIALIGGIMTQPSGWEPLNDEGYDLGDEFYHPGDED